MEGNRELNEYSFTKDRFGAGRDALWHAYSRMSWNEKSFSLAYMGYIPLRNNMGEVYVKGGRNERELFVELIPIDVPIEALCGVAAEDFKIYNYLAVEYNDVIGQIWHMLEEMMVKHHGKRLEHRIRHGKGWSSRSLAEKFWGK